ncbi:hypothetical protein AAH678_31010 [Sodalis endosymbiont of Spalangia cameroni]|uniref:hypothetical protein n=1 Tax=Sodalis praecaptivus TaxID=1239307 RepID=UPI0031FA264B
MSSRKPKRNVKLSGIELKAIISSMDKNELVEINKLVISRLSTLEQLRSQQVMSYFKPGDIVKFIAKNDVEITGVIIRLNQKSVTVHSANDQRWNVSPQFLTLLKRQVSDDNELQKNKFNAVALLSSDEKYH